MESKTPPDGIQAPRVCAGPRVPAPTPSLTTSPSLPSSVDDQGGRAGLIRALRERGVRPGNAESLVTDWPADRVAAAIRYFDQQQDVGAGVLVAAVREGRQPAKAHGLSSVDRNRLYGEEVCDWLNDNFPELRQVSGRPHPAAIAAVFRLHQGGRKGTLTRAQHGPHIKAAVKAFDKRYPDAADPIDREVTA